MPTTLTPATCDNWDLRRPCGEAVRPRARPARSSGGAGCGRSRSARLSGASPGARHRRPCHLLSLPRRSPLRAPSAARRRPARPRARRRSPAHDLRRANDLPGTTVDGDNSYDDALFGEHAPVTQHADADVTDDAVDEDVRRGTSPAKSIPSSPSWTTSPSSQMRTSSARHSHLDAQGASGAPACGTRRERARSFAAGRSRARWRARPDGRVRSRARGPPRHG